MVLTPILNPSLSWVFKSVMKELSFQIRVRVKFRSKSYNRFNGADEDVGLRVVLDCDDEDIDDDGDRVGMTAGHNGRDEGEQTEHCGGINGAHCKLGQ